MPFGIWTRVGQRKHVLGGGAHWRHLANTIEPSMCAADAAYFQITLTTCLFRCDCGWEMALDAATHSWRIPLLSCRRYCIRFISNWPLICQLRIGMTRGSCRTQERARTASWPMTDDARNWSSVAASRSAAAANNSRRPPASHDRTILY